MNVFRFIGIAVAIVGSFALAQAQPSPVLPKTSSQLGFVSQTYATTVTLGYSTVQTLVAIPPPAPVNLTPGTALKLNVGYNESDLVSLSWLKNNQPFGSAEAEISLTNLTESDSGYYHAVIHRTTGDIMSDTATIRVGFAARQTLLNLSTRATIGPANPTVICGFVVSPSPGSLNESKTLLVRAIGPALAQFGVAHPLASPTLKIFRSDGRVIDPPGPGYLLYLYSISMRIGAFPILAKSSDIAFLITLPAGVYTAQIGSDVVAGSGEVLFEIYEVPGEAFDCSNVVSSVPRF